MLPCGVSEGSTEAILDYCSRHGKIEQEYIFGKDCFYFSPEDVKQDFRSTKKIFNKLGGRQYYHLVQSFESGDEKVSPELAHQLGKDFIERNEMFNDFQVYMVTHIDKNHYHNHLVINSVSDIHGKKFQMNGRDLRLWKELSNEIARENQLREIDLNNEKLTREYKRVMTKMEKELVEKDIIPWKDVIYNALLSSEKSTLEFCYENNIRDNQQIFDKFKENLLDFNVEVMRGLNQKDNTITFRLKGENEDSMMEEELKNQKKLKKIRGNKLDPHFKNRNNIVKNIEIELEIKLEQQRELEVKKEIRETLDILVKESKDNVEKIALVEQITNKEEIGFMIKEELKDCGVYYYTEDDKIFLEDRMSYSYDRNFFKYEINFFELVDEISKTVEMEWKDKPNKEQLIEMEVAKVIEVLEKIYEETKDDCVEKEIIEANLVIEVLKEKLSEHSVEILDETNDFIKVYEYSEYDDSPSFGIIKENCLNEFIPEIEKRIEEIKLENQKEIIKENIPKIQSEVDKIRTYVSSKVNEEEISDKNEIRKILENEVKENSTLRNYQLEIKESKIEFYLENAVDKIQITTFEHNKLSEKLSEEIKLTIENNRKIEAERLEKIKQDKEECDSKLNEVEKKTKEVCVVENVIEKEKIQEVFESKIEESGLEIEWKTETFIAVYRYIDENKNPMGFGRNLQIIDNIQNEVKQEIELRQNIQTAYKAVFEDSMKEEILDKELIIEKIQDKLDEMEVELSPEKFNDIDKMADKIRMEVERHILIKQEVEQKRTASRQLAQKELTKIRLDTEKEAKQEGIYNKDDIKDLLEKNIDKSDILKDYTVEIEENKVKVLKEISVGKELMTSLNSEKFTDKLSAEIQLEIESREKLENELKQPEITSEKQHEFLNKFSNLNQSDYSDYVRLEEKNEKELLDRYFKGYNSSEHVDNLRDVYEYAEFIELEKTESIGIQEYVDYRDNKEPKQSYTEYVKEQEKPILDAYEKYKEEQQNSTENKISKLDEKYKKINQQQEKLRSENKVNIKEVERIDDKRDLIEANISRLERERDSAIERLKLEDFKPDVRKLFNKDEYERQQKDLYNDTKSEIRSSYHNKISIKQDERFALRKERNDLDRSVNANNRIIRKNNSEINLLRNKHDELKKAQPMEYKEFKQNYLNEQRKIAQQKEFENKFPSLNQRDYKEYKNRLETTPKEQVEAVYKEYIENPNADVLNSIKEYEEFSQLEVQYDIEIEQYIDYRDNSDKYQSYPDYREVKEQECQYEEIKQQLEDDFSNMRSYLYDKYDYYPDRVKEELEEYMKERIEEYRDEKAIYDKLKEDFNIEQEIEQEISFGSRW